MERCDQYECHTVKLFELCLLPTRGFDLHPIVPLNAEQRAELEEFQLLEKAAPATPWEVSDDRRMSDSTPRERYLLVRDERRRRVQSLEEEAALGDREHALHTYERKYWYDCDGLCPRDGTAQPPATGLDLAKKEVWGVLRDVRHFPEEIDDYLDLFHDRHRRDVYKRAQMRFVPEEHLQEGHISARMSGHVGATETLKSLPASHKLADLREFARIVCLDLDDLLEPRVFSGEEHAWVRAHNHLQDGKATAAEEVMANEAREQAIKLGCLGIRLGKRATGLDKVVRAVLEQQCGMKPATNAKSGLVTIRPGPRAEARCTLLVSMRVEEKAPGYAERMLVWHPKMHELVPAAEYASQYELWQAQWDERQREAELARGAHEEQFSETDMMVVDEEACSDYTGPTKEPFIKNVRYVHFEAAKIEECLQDWRGDEAQRRVAEDALLVPIARARATANDGLVRKLQAWRGALRKLAARHRVVEQLDKTLPPPDDEGRRTRREEYEYKERSLNRARFYAKGRWVDFGDNERRVLGFQGMPGDLRVKLCGRYYHDADGFCSDFKLYIHEAGKAKLRRVCTKLCRAYSRDRESRDAWHVRIAAWLSEKLGFTVEPRSTKRWPNILGNGGGYPKCLEAAGLPADTEVCPEVRKLHDELGKLRKLILNASHNRDYVARQRERLRSEVTRDDEGRRRKLTKQEIENKVFSYIIESVEDEVLHICNDTFRRLARAAVGEEAFDRLPAKYRDSGAFVFDGQAVQAREGMDMTAALRQAEIDLKERLDIEYALTEKDFYGRQDEPMPVVAEARRALAEALAECGEVREAVDGGAEALAECGEVREAVHGGKRKATPAAKQAKAPHGGKRKATPAAKQAKAPHGGASESAFVLLVREEEDEAESRVLLPLARRGGVARLGVLGGKAKAEDGASSLATAAREAHEETNGMLSNATCANIAKGLVQGHAWCEQARARVYVHVLEEEEDLHMEWPGGLELQTDAETTHLGLTWVPLSSLLSAQWRATEMHPHSAMIVASAASVLCGAASSTPTQY